MKEYIAPELKEIGDLTALTRFGGIGENEDGLFNQDDDMFNDYGS